MTTTIVGTSVLIDWVKPDDNFAEILEYEIVLHDSNEQEVQDLVNCNGNSDQVVIQFTQCTIPMSQIRLLTNLGQGQLIVARVRARNQNGWER